MIAMRGVVAADLGRLLEPRRQLFGHPVEAVLAAEPTSSSPVCRHQPAASTREVPKPSVHRKASDDVLCAGVDDAPVRRDFKGFGWQSERC